MAKKLPPPRPEDYLSPTRRALRGLCCLYYAATSPTLVHAVVWLGRCRTGRPNE